MKRLGASLALVLAVSPLAACGELPASHDLKPVSARMAVAAQPVTVTGVPDDLTAVISKVYNQEDLTYVAGPYVRRALAGRLHATQPINATGATGTWKGTPIAVVTWGNDFTLAVKAAHWEVVGGRFPSLGLKRPVLGGVRRVLAIGGDARPGKDFHSQSAGTYVPRSHADSLHIIGFNGRGGAGVLGIPRDTYAKLTTGGPKQKINGAMKKGGPGAELRTVSRYTHVPLEGYFLTGFEGFKHMIDDNGGLNIFVSRRVQILPHPSRLDIPRGHDHLRGGSALNLARARKHVPGGDFGRSANQSWILLSAAFQARAKGPRALAGILTKASPYLWTNLNAGQVLTFLANLYTVQPLKVVHKVATGTAKKVWTVGEHGVMERRYVVFTSRKGRAMFTDIRDGALSR